MDRRVTRPKRVTPPPCKQALSFLGSSLGRRVRYYTARPMKVILRIIFIHEPYKLAVDVQVSWYAS